MLGTMLEESMSKNESGSLRLTSNPIFCSQPSMLFYSRTFSPSTAPPLGSRCPPTPARRPRGDYEMRPTSLRERSTSICPTQTRPSPDCQIWYMDFHMEHDSVWGSLTLRHSKSLQLRPCPS